MKPMCFALLIFSLWTSNFNVCAQPPRPPVTKISSKNDPSPNASGSPSGEPSLFKFEHLSATDGLSHNKVQCILQDKQGYVWFGTSNGLNRYDGYSFKIFVKNPDDSSTVATDNITCLYQDREGLIWVGTATSAFSSYNPKAETFKNYLLPESKNYPLKGYIHDFKEDENGLLWLATGNGLFSFDKKNSMLLYHKTDDSSRENIHYILNDNNKDILWLSTETGIRKFNKKTESVKIYKIPYPAFSDIPREITHNIIRDRYGDIWMTTTDLGVYRLSPETEKLTNYRIAAADSSPFKKNSTTTWLMEDADGKIWIGGERLAFLDPSTTSISFYTNVDDDFGIQGKIFALIKDNAGIYWIGTERGIAKYDSKLYSFQTIPSNPTLQSANTILEDNDHNFWFGNYTGIGLFDPNTGIYTKNKVLDIKESVYSSLLDKNGSMWYGSAGCLFHVYKKSNGGKQNFNSERIQLPVAKIYVSALAVDANGIIWAGTRGEGVFRYDPFLKTFKRYRAEKTAQKLFSANDILTLHVISTESILIGTEGRGLMLLQPTTGTFKKIKFEKNEGTSIDYSIINTIYEDSKKNIWIGTENSGLWQTDVSLSRFKNYSIKDGLQSLEISQITEDDIGQIWLNSKLGLQIIDSSRKRFVQYSEKDGLNIDEPGYLIKKASGDLVRIDFNGLHIFRSSSINLNKDAPPVYINHLKVLDKEIPVFNDTTIRLKHNENYLALDYVALNYTQSFKNRYQYRLTNLDENWINAGERRFVSYANIGPGTYTFLVKACNNNGVWNDKPASLTLIISPPWWQTWWFYALMALAVFAAVYLGLSQLRLQQKMKAVELRNAISRDLHDEVGSTLSSINFLSSMALNDVEGNNLKVHKTLSSISESSHKMLDAMNDIIWSIQPQNDTLNNIIARMVAFASELLEARKILLHYRTGSNLDNLHLGVGIRHDFFVIFKEAVNNLAKYSEATEADINLEYLQPYIILTIKDNGKGFDPKVDRKGNGLKNMKKRAEKIGAKYHLDSVPGEGTTITLQIKPM